MFQLRELIDKSNDTAEPEYREANKLLAQIEGELEQANNWKESALAGNREIGKLSQERKELVGLVEEVANSEQKVMKLLEAKVGKYAGREFPKHVKTFRGFVLSELTVKAKQWLADHKEGNEGC